MSGLLYPNNLPGLKWDSERTEVWSTGVQPAVSFKESRISYAVFPVFEFSLQYEVLRDYVTPSDLKALVGLYGSMRGRWDTFLYTDPTYNAVVDEPFGTGDGSTQDFQLVATFQNAGGPGVAELIQNINGTIVIKKAGVTQTLTTHYTIGPTGIIHFVTAPTGGQALTWTGSFYYRCRFLEDRLTTKQFVSRFWSTRAINLRSIKL